MSDKEFRAAGEIPQGRRFSHVYLTPGELLPDSPRMRHRLSTLLVSINFAKPEEVLTAELGISIPWKSGGRDWEGFFRTVELRDVLDAVTVLASNNLNLLRVLPNNGFMAAQRTLIEQQTDRWISGVRRIIAEELVRYRVDDLGGVHFSVDSEFERNRAATIAGLGGARYANAAAQFEAAFLALDAMPPDGKAAVRGVFTSAEGLFRLMTSAGVLGVSELDKNIRPRIDALFVADIPARTASHRILASFQDWIAACHQYRHEPGTEEPAQPPLSLAIMLVSQGAGFIRWLIQIDRTTET